MKRQSICWGLLLYSVLFGCTTVGTGHRTVIRAACDDFASEQATPEQLEKQRLCNELAKQYPHLVAPTNTDQESRILRIDPDGRPIDPARLRAGTVQQPTYQQFLDFLKLKYGSADFQPVRLSFVAHDRTITPPFLSVDPRPAWLAGLSTLLLNTQADLSVEKKIELQNLLEARLGNVEDLRPATAAQQTVVCGDGCREDFEGCVQHCEETPKCSGKAPTEDECRASCSGAGELFFYYPRVSVDFSSELLSTTAIDRLSFLALVVRLREPAQEPECGSKYLLPSERVRFLDFRPKDADIAEFSRGDLTEALQLQASANIGSTGGSTLKVAEAPNERTTATGTSAGASTGVTFSENFVTKLADAIEKKTTGILDDGQTFFADLRSIRQIRVAGAYNFDLMLEVPSRPCRKNSSDNIESIPIDERVKADVYLLGVMRHVHGRGRIGVLNRVPESENDHVFEQVILKVLPAQSLWDAPGARFFSGVVKDEPLCKLRVVTNRDEAGFVVKDMAGSILASGAGRKADVSFSRAECKPCGQITISFSPVVLLQEGRSLVLEAGSKTVDFKDKSELTTDGTYRPAGLR